MAHQYTADELERILAVAVRERDMQGVEHALRLLAVTDPHRAEAAMDTMRLGLHLAGRDAR